MKTYGAWVMAIALATSAHATIRVEPVEYKQGDTTLRGQIAYDDAAKGKRPGVLVVHEWWGLNEYVKTRAKMLAEAGYVAFALDMFGDGKTTQHPEEAGKWATEIRQNQKLGVDRFNAAYDLLKKHERVDAGHMAAIGYCFGGSTVLTMALSGADLDGVASFHGGLPTDPATGKVTASILVCNGAADQFITAEQITTFQKNLVDAGADWEFVSYAGSKHGFTNPDADKRGMPQLAYNEKADKRSWQLLLDFLAEVCK
jgi:dienelactone hydrolase